MELDGAAKLVRAEFFQGVIRSAERMTYTNVNKVIEGDAEMTRALCAAGERVPEDEGTGVAAEQAAAGARLD